MDLAVVTQDLRDGGREAAADERDERLGRLVRLAAGGDELAWEALVAEFHTLVSGAARAHRLNDVDAADVAQTTWLRLVEHIREIQNPARLGAWLSTTAHRESLRVLQRATRQVVTDRVPEPLSEDDTAQRMLARERHTAVRRAFRRLKPSEQALLGLLMADRAPSYAQIGRMLGMPVGSIGPTRARSLVRLRRHAAVAGLAPTSNPHKEALS